MDTREIVVQVREAQPALLKACRILQDLRDWECGKGVARVRRVPHSAQLAQNSTERKLRETRELFQRGIIPRNELGGLEQQVSQQRVDLEAVRREVESARAEGQGENCQTAEMDLVNASVKYETLQAQPDDCTVCAPFAGIVAAAPDLASEQGSRGSVQANSRLGRGRTLSGLTSVERLEVSAKVSEPDIGQLHERQAVETNGDGFEGTTLADVITALGGQVLPGMAQGGSPQLETMVLVAPLDPR